jgi:hypothetical protein
MVSPPARARSLNRWILPVAVLDRSSMNPIERGWSYGARHVLP